MVCHDPSLHVSALLSSAPNVLTFKLRRRQARPGTFGAVLSNATDEKYVHFVFVRS